MTLPVPLESLAEWSACCGTLRCGERVLDVICDVSVAPDGTIGLAFNDVPMTEETWEFYADWLQHRGQTVPRYQLDLRDAQGHHHLLTDHAILSSVGHSSTSGSSVVQLEGEAARMSVTYTGPAVPGTGGETRLARYRTVGLRGLLAESADFDVGRVTLHGVREVSDHRHLAGALQVKHPGDDGESLEAWLTRCDERAQDILRMVSLGAGRMVSWSARETYLGGTLHHLELRGRRHSGPPFDPLFDHLELGRALQLAARHYSRELASRTGLDVAVDWYVMPHSYSEARFMASMTALEHLVSKHATAAGAVLPWKVYRVARSAMESALKSQEMRQELADALRAHGVSDDKVESTVSSALAQLEANLGKPNGRSFRDSIVRLLSDYSVRHDDITPAVAALVKVRNDIAHRGLRQDGEDQVPFRRVVSALRELLRRLFVSILEYEGEYTSHLDGPERRNFSR